MASDERAQRVCLHQARCVLRKLRLREKFFHRNAVGVDDLVRFQPTRIRLIANLRNTRAREIDVQLRACCVDSLNDLRAKVGEIHERAVG